MAISEQSASVVDVEAMEDRRKPPLSAMGILLMNFGFFGIQFSFGLQQSAINPIFTFIGADAHDLPILNLAGPMTGLIIQPLIGAMSDRTWHPRWGRRKPFFLIGALGCMIILAIFPFVGAIWTAVLCLWLLDASNNTAMEPYRAFIADRLPKNQLARGFLIQSMFVGLGAVSANASILIFQSTISTVLPNGIPFWVNIAFWIGAVCSIGSVLVSVLSTKEIPPTEEELEELRNRPKGAGAFFGEIASAVRDMPIGMHKIGLVFLFQWFAMAVYWQFIAVSMTETVQGFASTDGKPVSAAASGWVGAVNGMYNLVTIFAALALIPIAQKFGAKRVGAVALVLAGAGLLTAANMTNQYGLLVPMVGLGIGWASMLGIPYIMVASMVPKERSGVYMGVVNMMIVVPMLIQNVTFGWIFENLLGSSGSNAIMLSGGLLLCAAVAMLWINPPKDDEESELMPLGSPRDITVYDQVIVGSDGSPSSLYAVDRAHAVAAEADAQVVVVSAYNPNKRSNEPSSGHRDIYGQQAAEAALRKTVEHLTSDRVRRVEQRLVVGSPASALLAASSGNTRNLIVVGNRGLGAAEGEMLGEVAAAVVKGANCDVLIVQGTRDTVPRR